MHPDSGVTIACYGINYSTMMEPEPRLRLSCDAPDCGQWFESEELLSSHMNKHVLSLKLTLPEASCTVDETPTPSRFLKNFSKVSTDFLDRIDAQGTSPEKNSAINFVVEQDPFAETFRRASISKPKLHIPTIILTDENSGSLNTPSITLNPATRSPEAALPNLTVTVDDILPLNKDPKHSAVGPLNLSTSPVVSSDLTPGKHSTSSEVVEQVNGHTNKSSQKSSTNSSSQSSNGTNSSSQSSNSSSLSSDTSDEKKKTRGRTPKFLYQGITDKKERHRVRNREAAMRCREKKKMWKSTLQTSIDELKELKEKFMEEETELKLKASKLKRVLLVHKDCKQPKY